MIGLIFHSPGKYLLSISDSPVRDTNMSTGRGNTKRSVVLQEHKDCGSTKEELTQPGRARRTSLELSLELSLEVQEGICKIWKGKSFLYKRNCMYKGRRCEDWSAWGTASDLVWVGQTRGLRREEELGGAGR